MSSFVANVLRARDLFHAQFEFINLVIDAAVANNPVLKRASAGAAYIVVRLPPQSIVEAEFLPDGTRNLPYNAVLSGPSRLAFELPQMLEPIQFNLCALLERLTQLEPLTSGAAPSASPATLIEYPDRLLLAPETKVRLAHRRTPLAKSDPKTDLAWSAAWHTRILEGTPVPNRGVRFRAVGNASIDTADRLPGTTLNKEKRGEIARLCAASAADPHLIAASQFMLTALGTSARMKSRWPTSASPVLSAWEHETVVGRDRFVRTLEQGFLFPFGHRASLETIAQREFYRLPAFPIAELQRKEHVSVEEAEKSYEGLAGSYDFKGREMPLRRIRIISLTGTVSSQAPLQATIIATDSAGNLITCQVTMMFVAYREATNRDKLEALLRKYSNLDTATFRPQHVALAEDEAHRGDTTLIADKFKFGVKILPVTGQVQPPFLPFIASASVTIPAIDQMFGTSAGGGMDGSSALEDALPGGAQPARTLTFSKKYRDFGFAAGNPNQIFADLDPPIPAISVPAQRAGGLAAPRFRPMNGLSKVRGPVADVAQFADDMPIDPAQLVGESKLLGVIELKKVIEQARDSVPATDPEKLFETIEQNGVFATRPVMTTVRSGTSGAEVRFVWKPRLKTIGLPEPLKPMPGGTMALILKGRIRKAPDANVFEIDGKLVNFRLTFGDLLSVDVGHVHFRSGANRKMDVNVAVQDVTFESGLAFVKKIADLIPLDSLGKGPSIHPQPNGIVIRFGASIPSLAVGVLSIQNVALSSSISLPFVEGRPAAVRFALSERNNPFLVSVSIFGGTGFFAVEVRTDKSVVIEAAIEFGGIVSINLLGIIRGGVYAFAGVFCSFDTTQKLVVSGHLRFGGYVDVAGLVSVSIEFYIALEYNDTDKILQGIGRVTVSVSILFFSLSQSFSVSRRIAGFGEPPAGAAADAVPELPSFGNTMNLLQWEQYCGAFA